jgi:hypothetical protein
MSVLVLVVTASPAAPVCVVRHHQDAVYGGHRKGVDFEDYLDY